MGELITRNLMSNLLKPVPAASTVFVFGFALFTAVSVRAQVNYETDTKFERHYFVAIGDSKFGFIDWLAFDTREHVGTTMYCGPLGSRPVPFTAAQCMIGMGSTITVLLLGALLLITRWQKRIRDSRDCETQSVSR